MRFMVIVKSNSDSEAGQLPDNDMLAAMGRYNEELAKAGILLDLSGLHPSSRGSRVRFEGNGKASVSDGPFPETNALVAGYWILQCKSRDECIQWVKRAPFGPGAEIEIRQVFELSDFEMSADARALHERVGASLKTRALS